MNTFVVGGARSGKSSYAQKVAAAEAELTKLPVVYIATAESTDSEFAMRIKRHQQDRPFDWKTQEEPLQLAKTINGNKDSVILVDCLTLWLNNHMYLAEQSSTELNFDALIDELALAISEHGKVTLVSNEVGCGIIPMGEMTRQFVDYSGWMNQRLAAVCDKAVLVQVGLPQVLKGQTSE